MQDLRPTIEAAWENRNLLQESGTQKAIRAVVSALDSGELRVAEPNCRRLAGQRMGEKGCGVVLPYSKNGDD